MTPKNDLEEYFAPFRNATIGRRQCFESPFGRKEIIYADWTASGRAYGPIEECLQKKVMPFLANTHTEATITGGLMSAAYEEAKNIIKRHVHAGDSDVLIFCGSGMTGAVNKLQRILGMRVPERLAEYMKKATAGEGGLATGGLLMGARGLLTGAGGTPTGMPEGLLPDEELRPVVFVTEMEHHSNHISWLETIATVEIIPCDDEGGPDLGCFRLLLERYKDRKNKIAAVTACSNVTGIETPYYAIARMVHEYGGLCFVDFACSAPYVDIDMHPGGVGYQADEAESLARGGTHLDAIYFSPHKFLGGPGTPGVLIFNKKLYANRIPDQPGGGTVVYTNPWKVQEYVADIAQREDGGTPPFLQGIKAAMCIRLKEAMGIEFMRRREEEMLRIIIDRFARLKNVELLEDGVSDRLGIFSFVVVAAHHNLIVKLLNDRYGIQTRGGCSCAGTYGHRLLGVGEGASYAILERIRLGDMLCKPGWIRLSVHPTMTDVEIGFIMDAIEAVAANVGEWGKDYMYDAGRDAFEFRGRVERKERERVEGWFAAGAK